MKYYVLYVENTKSFFTYKSEEEYKPGEWCIVDFSGRKRSAVILRETEEDNRDKVMTENIKNYEINLLSGILVH